MCQHELMLQLPVTSPFRRAQVAAIMLALTGGVASVRAEGCNFASLGEGHVADIIDARSFRLTDGREIRLAGIEPAASDASSPKSGSALSRIAGDQDVILQG